tara:strand:+ start:262 stop:465 length:204 start_codon:yes stop_codon:yes gene_type:complete
MKATIQFFNTKKGSLWGITKVFQNQQHMNNYIDKVSTRTNHDLDEVFVHDVVDRFMSNTAKEFKPKK